ncbi:CHASE2 domain-containing sensor protein [Kitasatospora sp. MAA4]|uniref:YrdB family protein n=1 Tax=Kitasatospora sp. MAA4 TaxID=3035093 RepID=UPI0024758293|nr:YrdB family protein [Kitasatospora sp. MAA4]MDH6132936.1 CHASE2 domain-containing sensor protein [Kitasatospora sp. MAA4]
MSAVVDVLAFASELAVYGAAVWWAWTLRRPRALRLVTAVVAAGLLALVWGEFAAPTATRPLHGAWRAAFELCWFGAGALAAFRAWKSKPR